MRVFYRAFALSVCFVLLTLCLGGCPQQMAMSSLPLGGDSRLVGSWETTVEIAGYTAYMRSALNDDGSYLGVMVIEETGESATMRGYWYADPQTGRYDSIRTWTSLNDPSLIGTIRGYYQIDGNTLYVWANTLNAPRPASRETAAISNTYTRVENTKADREWEEEVPGGPVSPEMRQLLQNGIF